MSRAKLKRAPLTEVIFEIFWEVSLPKINNAIPTDPDYDLALGAFAEKVRRKFPIRKRIMPEGIKIYPRPEWQFWTKESTWPVIQLGPGMLTVNDTDLNYSWEKNFKSNIEFALSELENSYPKEPRFNKIRLQYINAIDFDGPYKDFIDKVLLTKIERRAKISGASNGLNVLELFKQDDGSMLHVNIHTGTNNKTNKPSVILIITVEKQQSLNKQQVHAWLEQAHNLTSTTFVSMIEPTFYGSFDK